MYDVIILAAGSGSRMQLGYNKMLFELDGIPVFIRTIKKFMSDLLCKQLVLVVNEQEIPEIKSLLKIHQVKDKRLKLISGGSERQYSVEKGLAYVKSDIVLVHDGARPFVTKAMIKDCLDVCESNQAAIVGVSVKDTIKRVVNNEVIETLNREQLIAVQTPQAVRTSILKVAHKLAKHEGFLGTDEGSLIERYCDVTVRIVQGSYSNIKLTTKEDLIVAREILKQEEKN